MANNITVAWSTPVDACALGARIETWVETKAAITTLRLSVQHAKSSTPSGRLPPEVVENIAGCLRQSFFEERLEDWEKFARCCEGSCSTSDHFSKEDYAKMKEDFLADLDVMVYGDCDGDEEFERVMESEGDDGAD